MSATVSGGAPHKGIILAGGSGTRLYPSRRDLQEPYPHLQQAHDLLPALHVDVGGDSRRSDHFDAQDTPKFGHLLSDGHQFGIKIQYAVRRNCTSFLSRRKLYWLVLCAPAPGDNIFYQHDFAKKICREASQKTTGREGVRISRSSD